MTMNPNFYDYEPTLHQEPGWALSSSKSISLLLCLGIDSGTMPPCPVRAPGNPQGDGRGRSVDASLVSSIGQCLHC